MESVVRRESPKTAPTRCATCRMDVPTGAQKCAHCGEWLGSTRLTAVDRALTILGWTWAVLSILGAVGLWWVSSSAPAAPSLYGEAVPRPFWEALPRGVIVALLLQGLVVGFGVVSFAQRGPREWAA